MFRRWISKMSCGPADERAEHSHHPATLTERHTSAVLTRRLFIQRVGSALALLFVPLQRWLPGDAPVENKVLRMRPVAGLHYSRAACNHINNRIFPSREALIAELPHRGLIFGIEELPARLSEDELKNLFAEKRSLDKRRVSDARAFAAIIAAARNRGEMLCSA
jgi:hypothetical protein